MRCEKCGAIMEADTTRVYTSNPPMYLYKCPKCGETKYGFCSEYEEPNPFEPKFNVGDIITHNDIDEPMEIIQVDEMEKKYRCRGGYVVHFYEEDRYELYQPNDKTESCGLEATLSSDDGAGCITMDYSFNAFDSELTHYEWTIPDGYTARIEEGKVIIEKTDC